MRKPNWRISTRLAATLLVAALCGAASAQPEIVGPIQKAPLDQTVTADKVEVACTGIGANAREDPRWKAFPVRVEFAAPNGDYFSDEIVSLSTAAGEHLITVACEGPWVLLKLPAGRYTIAARLNDVAAKTETATFSPPRSGQKLVMIHFPDAG
jgi:hypothetical protein